MTSRTTDHAFKPQIRKPSPLPWEVGEQSVLCAPGTQGLKTIWQRTRDGAYNQNSTRYAIAENCKEEDAILIVRAVNSHAAVMAKIKSIVKAHDRLSDAVEDPDGGNDAEHDAAVKLLGKLLDLYAALRVAGEEVRVMGKVNEPPPDGICLAVTRSLRRAV
jgi:hypothetical protein